MIDRSKKQEEKPRIVGRLGQVIYWLGCAAATLIAAFVTCIVVLGTEQLAWGPITLAIVAAGLFWLIGRVARFILKGD